MNRLKHNTTVSTNKNPEGNANKEQCRVCLTNNVVLINIFGCKSRDIAVEMHYCTGIIVTQTDNLPKKICCTCLNNLSTAYTFKQLCLATDSLLKDVHKHDTTDLKEEIVDLDDDIWNDDDDNGKDCELKTEERETDVQSVIETKTKEVKKQDSKKQDVKKKIKMKQVRTKNVKYKIIKKQINLCNRCNIEFSTRKLLVEHNTQVHNEQETYICDTCAKIYYKFPAFDSHLRTHCPPKFFCDQCDYKTAFKTSFRRHITSHSEVKSYECDKCERAYNSLHILRAHYRRVHEDRKKTVYCPRCNRAFFCKSRLKRHIDTHDNIKRYQCQLCFNKFSRREIWKKHMLTQHNIAIPNGKRGVKLPECEEYSLKIKKD